MTITVAPSTAIKMAHATFLRESRTPSEEGDLAATLAEFVKSDYASEDYSWVGEPPRMELLEDELRIGKLSDAHYSITNRTYAIGLEFKRRDLRLDRLGALMMRVRQAVEVAKKHRNRLLIAAIEAATVDTGHDGSAIFANAHANRGAGTQDNLAGGTGTTVAQIQADLNSAIQMLAEFDAENAEPYNEGLGQLIMLAPWGLRSSIVTALGAEVIAQTSNVNFRDRNIRPVFSARLTDANDWYLFHVGGAMMPLILQELDGLEASNTNDRDDELWLRKETILYKVRWDGAVGWGHWASSVKVVN